VSGCTRTVDRGRGSRSLRAEAGSITVETLMTISVLFVMLLLIVAAGWYVTARDTVSLAAVEAARAASLARDADQARVLAESGARIVLDNSDIRCTSTSVVVDTSGFAVPVGEEATVTVTVSCEVPLAQYGLPGLGDRTETATAGSAIDTYRERG